MVQAERSCLGAAEEWTCRSIPELGLEAAAFETIMQKP